MKIGITGASGFIGRHLIAALRAAGHECVGFTRQPSRPAPGGIETRPAAPERALDVRGLDAVVNLAGESIMGRWTTAKKKRVIQSRVITTERVVNAMQAAGAGGPRVLISASATGFYGDRGEQTVDETSAPGVGFLPEVTQQWEAAARASAEDLRVACVRLGFVFGADGGGFPPLRRIFSVGLGGRLGSGEQWMSPVHVDDVAGLMTWLIKQPAAGIFNATCPQPVRNGDFTRELARVLGRPAVLPAPAWALRLALGEMSHLMLDSQRVLPTRTLEQGYRFKFPDLRAILADLTGKQK